MSIKDLEKLGDELAAVRKRPCVFFVSQYIEYVDLDSVAEAISKCEPTRKVDLVVQSPGGSPDASYLVAREFGRHFEEVSVFVPLLAKSGATLVALVGNEIVVGRFGELGPIDVQIKEAQRGEFKDYRSCLERSKALEQLQRHSIETFDLLVRITLAQELNVLDACEVASNLTGTLMAPLYSQLKPEKIAHSARYLELSEMYADRILKRYGPSLSEDKRGYIVRTLGRRYPTHGMVVDLEELKEIGLTARSPAPDEAPIIEGMAEIFKRFGNNDYFGVSLPGAKEEAAGQRRSGGKREATVQNIHEASQTS